MTQKESIFPLAGISAIASYLPKKVQTSLQIEKAINRFLESPIEPGSIERLTGVATRHISLKTEYNSTLAIEACLKLFSQSSVDPKEIDLLIFASTGQDVMEPATAHIVQAGIGTNCPVMDVTNACNSFLNALEIATAFVKIGKYKSVLIATGEVPTKSTKYRIKNRELLQCYIPGYTFGDAGTAILVDNQPRIALVLDSYFFAESSNWDVAMLPGGGSRFLSKRSAYYFSGNATELMKPFFIHTKKLFNNFLERHNLTTDDISHVFVHQVASLFLSNICYDLVISRSKIEATIEKYGNVAAASIPLAMDLRLKKSRPQPNSLGLCIGLAGGISIGFVLLRFM